MNVVLTFLLLTTVAIHAEEITREKIVRDASAEIGKLIRYFLATRELTIEDINQLGLILTQRTEIKSKIIQEANEWAKKHNVKQYFDKVTEDLRRSWQMEEAITRAFVDGLLTSKEQYEDAINQMEEYEEDEKPEVVGLLEQRHAVEKALRRVLRRKKLDQIKKKDVPRYRRRRAEKTLMELPQLRKRLLEKTVDIPKLRGRVVVIEEAPATPKLVVKKAPKAN